MGHSAGAPLLDTAALDVSRLMTQKHARLYDRAFGDNPICWRKVSAVEHLHNKSEICVISLLNTARRQL
jgi:hypothetical protein